MIDHLHLTSVSCHVTVDLYRVSVLLRVDPVLPISNGISGVPDVLAGMARLIVNKPLIATGENVVLSC